MIPKTRWRTSKEAMCDLCRKWFRKATTNIRWGANKSYKYQMWENGNL